MKAHSVFQNYFFIFAVMIILSACSYERDPNYVPPEQPHLYWKDIDVVVEDISYRHWYAYGHHYEADISVYSEEYGLSDSFNYTGDDAEEFKHVRRGDIIKAELDSWVMDSTGEIVKRSINSIRAYR